MSSDRSEGFAVLGRTGIPTMMVAYDSIGGPEEWARYIRMLGDMGETRIAAKVREEARKRGHAIETATLTPPEVRG